MADSGFWWAKIDGGDCEPVRVVGSLGGIDAAYRCGSPEAFTLGNPRCVFVRPIRGEVTRVDGGEKVHGGAISGPVRTFAGSKTYIDPEYDERSASMLGPLLGVDRTSKMDTNYAKVFISEVIWPDEKMTSASIDVNGIEWVKLSEDDEFHPRPPMSFAELRKHWECVTRELRAQQKVLLGPCLDVRIDEISKMMGSKRRTFIEEPMPDSQTTRDLARALGKDAAWNGTGFERK